MKVILDNIIYSKVKNGGVSNYWFELSKYLMNETNHELKFIEEKSDLCNFHRKQLNFPQESIISKSIPFSIVKRVLPITYSSSEKFIYHSSFYRKLIGSKNKVEVTTIHDFTHNFYAPFLKKTIHNSLKYDAIKRSKGIICISENTFSDLKKFCPTRKNQNVEVIYNGVSNEYYPIKELTIKENIFFKNLKINEKFILYVGSRVNYKNFDFIVEMINQIDSFKLVIVGGGDLTQKEKKLFSGKSLKDRIVFISSVNNDELNVLYNKAFVFVYPSSYEGFGIPIIEAMRAGCPVIVYDNQINQEITENKALLLKKLSKEEFLDKMDLLNNPDYRTEIIEKGYEVSKKYSWQKCCKETTEFYESLY